MPRGRPGLLPPTHEVINSPYPQILPVARAQEAWQGLLAKQYRQPGWPGLCLPGEAVDGIGGVGAM